MARNTATSVGTGSQRHKQTYHHQLYLTPHRNISHLVAPYHLVSGRKTYDQIHDLNQSSHS